MDHKITLEGITEATEQINYNADFLINHATDQLFYLDELINKMNANNTVLVNETYSDIILLEFETVLLINAIESNRPAIKIDASKLEMIKNNCDDLLTKTKTIRTIQESRTVNISIHDLKRIANNEADIDLGGS